MQVRVHHQPSFALAGLMFAPDDAVQSQTRDPVTLSSWAVAHLPSR
jgi:hypothetical protein